MTIHCQLVVTLGTMTAPSDGAASAFDQLRMPTSESADPQGPAGLSGARRNHRSAWMAIAALLAVVGIGGSAFAFSAVRGETARSHKDFSSSSIQIAAALQLAIAHEQDLIVSTQSFIIGNPQPSQAQFTQWAKEVNALPRYPELLALLVVQYVPADRLGAYEASVAAKQAKPFVLTPPGVQPSYCFVSVGVGRTASETIPANYNLCAGTLGQKVRAARNSGVSAVLPVTGGGDKSLALEIPIYSTSAVPSTVAARQAAFVEVIGLDVRPNVLLQTALNGHANTAVDLRFGSGASAVSFHMGHAPAHSQSMIISLHDGWAIETVGVLNSGGIFGAAGGFPLLAGGILLSLLLGLLIYVLGSGRAQSRDLVDERTDELRFQALHDSLTGLPNRALIMDRIDQLLARNRRNGTVGAALYVDLDDFKNVNDSLGHETGDRLLAAVATRMASTLRGADTIGRMGGDEFVILIDGSEPMVAPELVAERLLDVMRQPFEFDGSSTSLHVNTSIGIAVGDRATGGELLRDADIALYQAKSAGKNRYEFFHPEMQTTIGRRIQLEFDLRSALAAEQFRLVYQPIYNLGDLSVVGVEALLRWQHPVDGVLSPDEFIPILEQTGQIRDVGAWVLHEACGQMAAWHAQGDRLTVSVNVSGRQLDDDRIVEHIRHALRSTGLQPTFLIIEVTETALMRDTESAVRRLHAIKDLGVSVAVDDFGTGYSSLAYLQQFPVDCIKIDKSFTSAMVSSPESDALIRTFVQLGKDLGLTTLAEGVETASEMDLLRADNVDEAQGYLFARPLDPETLEAQFLAPTRFVTQSAPPEGS
jgi:diguanylate cyclase (GGDEF)-like protein